MILITAPIHTHFLNVLDAHGLKYRYLPDIDFNTLQTDLSSVVGLVVSTHIPIDRKMLETASQLQWIARLGSGMEHIDVAFAESKGIRCISSPEGNRRAVAEHAMGLLLSVVRNINACQNELKQFQWLRDKNRGMELEGKTVGIIGFGNTGSTFGRLLAAFGMQVLAYDKYRQVQTEYNIKEATLSEIMEQADVISLHLPYTMETHYLAGADFFRMLKCKPIILNTSRGSVLDAQALCDALDEGLISGAGLDVLENEKPESFNSAERVLFERLIHDRRIVLTPHIAGYTRESPRKMAMVILEKLGLTSPE
jgi:D-3-phosphoglycerate dehydrogenase